LIKPLDLDVIEGELSPESKGWVLQAKNGQYLIIPDDRYPGRHPIRFFMSKADAERVRDAVLDLKPELRKAKLVAIELPLQESLRRIATDSNPDHADSFVVHSPNEVYEFVTSLKRPIVH
jgi:hypothetical protein